MMFDILYKKLRVLNQVVCNIYDLMVLLLLVFLVLATWFDLLLLGLIHSQVFKENFKGILGNDALGCRQEERLKMKKRTTTR
jgi:hypothetical protein